MSRNLIKIASILLSLDFVTISKSCILNSQTPEFRSLRKPYCTLPNTTQVQVILSDPQDITISAGIPRASLTCKVIPNFNTNIFWTKLEGDFKLDNNTTTRPKQQKLILTGGNDPQELILYYPSFRFDRGCYMCVVMCDSEEEQELQEEAYSVACVNIRKEGYVYENITVQTSPTFIQTTLLDPTVTALDGQKVYLICPATGNPSPNISWYYKPLKESEWMDMGPDHYNVWVINFKAESQNNRDQYACIVCNFVCINFTVEIKVSNDHSKSFEEGLFRNITVKADSSAEMVCPSVAAFVLETDQSVQWIKLSDSFQESDVNKAKLMQISNTKTPRILKLENAQKSDEGLYTCVTGNNIDRVYSNFRLIVTSHNLEQEDNQLISYLVIALVGTIILGTIAVTVAFCRGMQKERAVWIKKVYVEKQFNNDSADLLLAPRVSIGKAMLKILSSSEQLNTVTEFELPLDPDWEVKRDSLILKETLGEGAYGKVVRAEAVGMSNKTKKSTVAVKLLKDEPSDDDMISLVSEMEVMKMIGKHKNIINLLGVCTQEGPLYVIMEYASYGNLKKYLHTHQPPSDYEKPNQVAPTCFSNESYEVNKFHQARDLVFFAKQIAEGMAYFHSKKCVHRDLAARNILVSENLIMKIADFGLSRDVHESDYYRQSANRLLPIKWMAPESLKKDGVCSYKSDVWSFGILFWEIITYGASPYPGVSRLPDIIALLDGGYRMKRPSACPENVYDIILKCWEYFPADRPNFREIVDQLDTILCEGDEYVEVTSENL